MLWLIEAMRPIEAKENAGKEDHPSQDDLYHFMILSVMLNRVSCLLQDIAKSDCLSDQEERT